MPKILYDFKKHHYEYLLTQNSPTEALNNWPFDDMFPTWSSIRRRLDSVKAYGVEKCLKVGGGNFTKRSAWTKEEEELLILAHELCEGREQETINLFREIFPERGAVSIEGYMAKLVANDRLKRVFNTRPDYKPSDYYESLLSRGFMPLGNTIGYGKTVFEVECIAYGHKTTVRAIGNTGCNLCSQAGSMPLSQLKNHKLGQHPCIIYFVQFEDGTLKTGHTKRGTQIRGSEWPPFKIIKEIETTYYHARRIETETQNQCDRIPQYLPLHKKGGTECFEEKHYERILEILNKEEKDLLEHEKNSS